jgi:hypothetical protein
MLLQGSAVPRFHHRSPRSISVGEGDVVGSHFGVNGLLQSHAAKPWLVLFEIAGPS